MNIFEEQITKLKKIYKTFENKTLNYGRFAVDDPTIINNGNLELKSSSDEEFRYDSVNFIIKDFKNLGIDYVKLRTDEWLDEDKTGEIIIIDLDVIHCDGYICYYSRHTISIDGVEEPEFVISKDETLSKNSSFGPCMLSTSGMAVFEVSDSNTGKIILMDNVKLAELLELDLDPDYKNWDDYDMSILKMALPSA